tara:strand:+ start:42 stop:623 length:582 start_codon:yes stop_codon:yes gene_type:complete
MEVFKVLSQIDVNGKTEKKGKFTYLSWAFAWGELKKVSPTVTSKVYHDKNTNMPYFASKAGVMVKVGVTVEGLEHINYLPVMDFRNAAILPEKVTMMDINKTIQRSTVKAIALHGLGLYIYAGEDLPEEPELTEEEKIILIEQEKKAAEDRKPSLKDSEFDKAKLFTKEQIKTTLKRYRMSTDRRDELTKLSL